MENDKKNTVTRTIVGCHYYLVKHTLSLDFFRIAGKYHCREETYESYKCLPINRDVTSIEVLVYCKED